MNVLTRTVPRKELAVLLLIGICSVAYFARSGSENEAPTLVPVDSTYTALRSSYSGNSIAFNDVYKGKSFHLHGTVVSVTDSLAGPNVTIAGPGSDPYWAIFKTDAGLEALKPGDDIDFTCDSFDMGIQMDGCTLNRAR